MSGEITINEQLASWVEGNPIHLPQHCCPDFSCCRPELLAPVAVRELFAAAYTAHNEAVEMRMLMEFLGKAFDTKRVYIAGLDNSREER